MKSRPQWRVVSRGVPTATVAGQSCCSSAAISRSLLSCSRAWCPQKRSSPPEASTARTWAAAPQRSQRSAAVNAGRASVVVIGVLPPSRHRFPDATSGHDHGGRSLGTKSVRVRCFHSDRRLGVRKCSHAVATVLTSRSTRLSHRSPLPLCRSVVVTRANAPRRQRRQVIPVTCGRRSGPVRPQRTRPLRETAYENDRGPALIGQSRGRGRGYSRQSR